MEAIHGLKIDGVKTEVKTPKVNVKYLSNRTEGEKDEGQSRKGLSS